MRSDSFAARKSSTCAVCTQEIRAMDIITRVTGGFMWLFPGHGMQYVPGNYAHEGCVPANRYDARNLYLTYAQIDALLRLDEQMKVPAEVDMIVRRLTGAARAARHTRYDRGKREPGDVALALGPDLLTAYEVILAKAELAGHSIGDWHKPKLADGTDYGGPKEAPAELRPSVDVEAWRQSHDAKLRENARANIERMKRRDKQRVAQGLPSQLAAPVILGEDSEPTPGWMVRGTRITPVEIQGVTADNRMIRCRPLGSGGTYTLVSVAQVYDREEDAKQNVTDWLKRTREVQTK